MKKMEKEETINKELTVSQTQIENRIFTMGFFNITNCDLGG